LVGHLGRRYRCCGRHLRSTPFLNLEHQLMSQATHPIQGVRVTHEITSNHHAHAMTHVAEPIIEILSAYGQRNGNTFALYGGLYAMGCALASVGANLEPGVDLRQQLEPMLTGYKAMRESQAKAQAH
jgi:hypothetical protein